MLLTAKTALVTGAANRLGAQIARTLHQNGANLIIHYRASSVAAQALVVELNQSTQKFGNLAIGAELGFNCRELEQLAAKACERLLMDCISWLTMHRVSIPPNSAKIKQQVWDDLIASNYKAPLFLSQACYPALTTELGLHYQHDGYLCLTAVSSA